MTRNASLIIAILALSNSVSFSQLHWEPCSGAPYGPVNAIAVDPGGNVYTLLTYSSYDGPYAGGIYRLDSATNRRQWLTGAHFYQDEYFSCMAVDSSGTLYTSPFPDYPYCSSDNGKSWRRISGNLPEDPETSSPEINAFACGRNGLLYAGMDNGVFRSSDRGNSWTRADSGLGDDTTVNLLAIDTDGVLFAATYSGLFRSSDSGNFWVRIDTGRFTAIAVDMKNRTLVSRGHTLFRSTDSGISWSDLRVPVPSNVTISSIAAGFAGRIWIGTYTARGFRSLDDGASWSPFGANISDTAFLSVAFNPSGNLFVGTNTSIIESKDAGRSWISLGVGIQGAGQMMPLPNGNIIATGEGGGILEGPSQTFLTTDEGDTWSQYPFGQIGSYCTAPSGTLFVTTGRFGPFDTSVARSTDTGRTWKPVYFEPRGLSSIVAGGNGDVFFIDNYNGILRSTDSGTSWSTVLPQPQGGSWSKLFFAKGNLYAASDSINSFITASLFRSSDNGANWESVCNSLPYIESYAPFGSDKKGDLYLGADDVIYRSTDSGFTWHMQAWTQGSAVAFGNDSVGGLYCGMAGVGPPTILRTTNNGLSWAELDDPSFQGVSAFATISNGRVFVGTSAGVFRSIDSGVAGIKENVPNRNGSSLSLQNAPNPVKAYARLSFWLPRPSFVTLKLFDAAGGEIATLANRFMGTGPHSLDFDRGALSAGIYFYCLIADGKSETKAMVIQ